LKTPKLFTKFNVQVHANDLSYW